MSSGPHAHDHSGPLAVDVEREDARGVRRLGLLLALAGLALIALGAWLLAR